MSRMQKASTALACAVALVVAVPRAALAWNAGTHAYVADQLHKGGDVPAAEWLARLYGANGPDLFNYVFEEPYSKAANYLHEGLEENAAERLWGFAVQTGDPVLMAYAYGFAAHDNAFGADNTAHNDAVTGGLQVGYVTSKADILAWQLDGVLPVPAEMVPLVTHLLVELGVDVLVAEELDPSIGAKLMASADASPAIGGLLGDAFSEPLAPYFGGSGAAEAVLAGLDQWYRPQIIQWYALALSQDDPFVGIADWMVQAAPLLLGIELSQDLAQQALYAAMETCRDDYRRELFSTIGRVNAELSSRGIVP